MILEAESRADAARCQQRAQWEAASRAGKSAAITYKVQGWRQSSGELWEPNLLVLVSDALVGVDGAELLIAEVTYTENSSGELTEMLVGPREAWELLQPQEVPKKKRTGPGRTSEFGLWNPGLLPSGQPRAPEGT